MKNSDKYLTLVNKYDTGFVPLYCVYSSKKSSIDGAQTAIGSKKKEVGEP